MCCNFPIKAWQSTKADDRKLLFEKPLCLVDSHGFTLFRELEIKCGQCMGCRLDHALDWAIRLVHESKMHQDAIFLTLTYDDDHYPADSSLHVDHMQAFFKRLRARLGDTHIRYFYSGEYGDRSDRAHYHAIVYGWTPPDLQLLKKGAKNSPPLYVSSLLVDVWRQGYVIIGEVNFDTCSYVARYVTKKMKGKKADEHYHGRAPEFSQMSRRPGIGATFWDTYKSDILVHDAVVYGLGKKARPCRFYDRRYDMENPGDLLRIKKARRLAAEMEYSRKYGKFGADGENRRRKNLEAREQKQQVSLNLFAKKGI